MLDVAGCERYVGMIVGLEQVVERSPVAPARTSRACAALARQGAVTTEESMCVRAWCSCAAMRARGERARAATRARDREQRWAS